ncbi:TetR family transcriptional regulator [Streptomyces sp. NPDC050636]|uniref:TetR/AcrR family transcriptional regulator n=1 Tax=Streptomyces sp. NPDC050636 TaxID=3154510 RepID=UPI003435C12C
MADQSAPRRRRDPQRRIEEMAAAAERVIAVRGIEGLTHRAVAEEAGVPLGATTYHFATKDDLIHAALDRSVDRYAVYLEEWVAQRPDLTPEQLVALLTDVLMGIFGPQRNHGVEAGQQYCTGFAGGSGFEVFGQEVAGAFVEFDGLGSGGGEGMGHLPCP